MSFLPEPLSLPDDGDLFIRPDSLEVEPSPPNTNLIRARWNGQLVVVKRMALDVSEEMLEAHARNWRSCVHPHVSRICGIADRASDPLFIVMPFYDLGNIHHYLAQNPQSNRQQMVFEAASGMQYLHKNGLIHGNLHPANIFITNDGHVNISEYSMFAFQHNSRHPQSYQYLSPESLKGTSPRSRASDVYSFAMCALEIFTSVSPWGALSEKHIYHLVVLENSRPDRPDDHRITDDLWNIIDSAWHQEPRSRPTFDFIVRLWRASSSQADIPPDGATTALSPLTNSKRHRPQCLLHPRFNSSPSTEWDLLIAARKSRLLRIIIVGIRRQRVAESMMKLVGHLNPVHLILHQQQFNSFRPM
ncbi:MAG: kinase-like domain-containing protein [Lentinula lateritia]|nr:MAG: kinase-like domain-containing protein [Lentinula lateritia]